MSIGFGKQVSRVLTSWTSVCILREAALPARYIDFLIVIDLSQLEKYSVTNKKTTDKTDNEY